MGVRAWVAAGLVAASTAWAAGAQAALVNVDALPPAAPGSIMTTLDVGDYGEFIGFSNNNIGQYINATFRVAIPIGATIHFTLTDTATAPFYLLQSVMNPTFGGVVLSYANAPAGGHLNAQFSAFNPGFNYRAFQLTVASEDLGGLTASPFNVSYSIDLSAPAPEPGTWALMLAGFAGLGAYRWRRVSTS